MRKLLILIPLVVIAVCIVTYAYFARDIPTSDEMDVTQSVRPVTPCPVPASFPGLSREISNVEEKKRIFEKDAFTGGYSERDDFINDWYEKQLTAMDEPSLLDPGDPEKEIYRFLWLRTFDHPMSVRIEQSLTETKLIFTETSGAGGYEPGNIIRREENSIDDSQWCSFLTLMDQAGYWRQGEDKDGGGQDGAQWIVEGVREGRYHLVDRQSPSEGEYREACLYLLKMAGVDPKKSGRGLY